MTRTRPAGIGSVTSDTNGSSTPGASIDNINPDLLPTIRFDNGGVTTGYSVTGLPGSPTNFIPVVRITRLSTGGADGTGVFDEWIGEMGSNALDHVLVSAQGTRDARSGGGPFSATRDDDLYLGDIRRIADLNSSFDISQVLLYSTDLTGDQVAEIYEWLVTDGRRYAASIRGMLLLVK